MEKGIKGLVLHMALVKAMVFSPKFSQRIWDSLPKKYIDKR